MRGAIPIILSAAAMAAAAPLAAQDPIATGPAVDEALIQLGNSQTRMTVPVTLGGSGPYGFIIDTGAERTVVSRELAGHLKLDAGRRVHLTAMTGTSDVGTVVVPSLSVSRISRARIEAPALSGADLGAVGMLGIDSLQGHAISIDFDKNEMTLRPVEKRRSRIARSPDEVVVTAKNLYGQLIVTDAHYRGRQISVIIDTGSPISIGNTAFQDLLTHSKSLGTIDMVSALGDTLTANYASVDRIEIGGMTFRDVPMGFAEAAPFARFGLSDTPALLLGMNALRLFRSVQIDFVSRQVRFLFPRGALMGDAAVRL